MTALKSNTEWKQWGKDDPLYGVAAWPNKRKGEAGAWTDEEFYALGESDWRDFFRHWQHYGVNRSSCLEIGCGAGRITKQLALSFDRVYAVDVSDDMIRYARDRVDARNLEFSVVDGLNLPYADRSVTAVFSTHVFQHLDSSDVGYSCFREIYRVLAPGGTVMVHLPLYQFPAEEGKAGAVLRSIWSLLRRLDDAAAGMLRWKRVKIMRMTRYPIRSLHAFLTGLGYRDVEFRIFPTKINGDPHPFVFATR